MKQSDTVSRRQFAAMGFVSVLAPLIRRFPRILAQSAGRAAWLCAPLAALPLAATVLVFWLLYRRAEAGTGLLTVFSRCWGRSLTRLLAALYGLWLVFYAGFLLRSGADRFVSTVYAGAQPWVFIAPAAALCALAALGSLKAIARSAMLFRPLLAALFVLVFLLTLKDYDLSRLLPVTAADLPGCALGALETANVFVIVAYLGFVSDRLEGRFVLRDILPWTGALLAIVALMTVGCVGMFGPELTAKLRFPFFMLVRDLSIPGAIERIEPVVIALWVLSDFVCTALLFQIAAVLLRAALGLPEDRTCPRITDLKNGRWLALAAALAAVAAALAIPAGDAAFQQLSETLVPAVSAVFTVALPLLTLAVGALRRRV